MLLMRRSWILLWLVQHAEVIEGQEPSVSPSQTSFPSIFPSTTTMPSTTSAPSFPVPTGMPSTNTPTSFCYTNTTAMYEVQERQSIFIDKTYILCPDTVFDIGFNDATGNCCVDGQFAIYPRSRSVFKCGEDGKSSNNCIIRGGDNQLVLSFIGFFDTSGVGITIMGLTFEGALLGSQLFTSPGDVTYIDCIFRDTKAVSQIATLIFPPRGRRRLAELGSSDKDAGLLRNSQKLLSHAEEYLQSDEGKKDMEIDYDKDTQRHLQVITLTVTFRNCTFERFEQGPTTIGGIPSFGIITARTPLSPFVFDNCIFRDNYYEDTGLGHAISTGGSLLEIRNTCFLNNSFSGLGPILATSGGAAISQNNFNAPGQDDSTFCEFIARANSGSPETPADVLCVPSDALDCFGETFAFTTPPPVYAPTAAPDRGDDDSNLILLLLLLLLIPCCAGLFFMVLSAGQAPA